MLDRAFRKFKTICSLLLAPRLSVTCGALELWLVGAWLVETGLVETGLPTLMETCSPLLELLMPMVISSGLVLLLFRLSTISGPVVVGVAVGAAGVALLLLLKLITISGAELVAVDGLVPPLLLLRFSTISGPVLPALVAAAPAAVLDNG